MDSQKILVTGGGFFISANLFRDLEGRVHEVLAVDLGNNERDHYVRSDVRNFWQFERIFEKIRVDYVYHLATEYVIENLKMKL